MIYKKLVPPSWHLKVPKCWKAVIISILSIVTSASLCLGALSHEVLMELRCISGFFLCLV